MWSPCLLLFDPYYATLEHILKEKESNIITKKGGTKRWKKFWNCRKK